MSFALVASSPYLWLAVAAAAAIVEALSVSLITMWFVIGALVAFVIAFAGGPLWLQLVAFLVVSVATLVLLRPVILKNRKRGQSHEATLVGTTAVVTEPIDPEAMTGRVETPDRITWTAVSADGSALAKGQPVRIVGQQSIKLVVERM